MRITKTASHAFRILAHCGRLGERHATIGDIARASQITVHSVFRIVPAPVEAGFLGSSRPRAGGVRPARPPCEVRIGGTARAIEPRRMKADCFGRAEVDRVSRPSAPIDRLPDDAFSAFVEGPDHHALQDRLDLGTGAGTGTARDPLAARGAPDRLP